jgi:general secretion pathway protein F
MTPISGSCDDRVAMKFRVRTLPVGGNLILEELLEADSELALRQRITTSGGVVVSLREEASRTGADKAVFEVALWCRELEALLRAGMTVVEAVETLAVNERYGASEDVNRSLLQALREGLALSGAMRSSGAFPEVLIAGVTASERTSSLQEALRDFLRYDELLQKLQRQAVSAMLYPAVVIGLGALLSLFLLIYVIPRFSQIYGTVQPNVGGATSVVIALSHGLRDFWPHALVGGLTMGAGLFWAWRAGRLGRFGNWLLEALPGLERRWRHLRLAKLYQSLALLFRGGYSFDEALRVCSGLALGTRLHDGIAVARQLIANGRAASVAMTQAGFADVTATRLLAVGERTGDFAGVLQSIADWHAQAFTLFIERATRLIEPLLLLCVALVVGGLVIMMYLPIFDVASGLGGGP